mmetsp:Transcript_14010/g.35789  ORF Transcript_14010/g.35789 Transcript_14010/m.35789 type:complete len:209 (+) Transcript_14010:268-894(+)|eukprot:CAMPEP_0177656760 /NCGR_PEP_ID=MMETSP0447-20121125/15768_1 /TAXON_ID=0 /ORGANISM="Stygamoeba regulata, Strain BSH-02190019" /LENGTH=208 /DNA_ID=CAMNT_0019160959 /DNA_START=259 /DNA_END=885 /DNA_ORIENTATION=-
MVFFFTTVDSRYRVFMGKDKFENENLIKYGWPEDIWFHVDKLSSAHVYLRLPVGETIDDIPEEVLTDCCQLVKANSIKGNKMNHIGIVYTPWANLKKTSDMVVGQVGFHNDKQVKTAMVETRINVIINRLEKTRTEAHPNLQAEKAERDEMERRQQKEEYYIRRKKEQQEKEEAKKIKEMMSYDRLFDPEVMKSNKELTLQEAEDDFM